MLRESKGNMYDFVTHTWNVIKGLCPHGCIYCYMKRWVHNPFRLDNKEFKTDLGKGNFIFVGSSIDMFAKGIPTEWILKVLHHCCLYSENKYIFQTKNPGGGFTHSNNVIFFPKNSIFCVTLETNRYYPSIMKNSPTPENRMKLFMGNLGREKMITIEPIMDFDSILLFEMIKRINPKQVNIGADSGNNNLPEPKWIKIMRLINDLENAGIKIHQKKNLRRLKKGKNNE